MLFDALRRRRRQRLLAEPFPETWLDYLHRNVAHYHQLLPNEQEILRRDLRILIAEKNWEGCGGVTMTEEIQVTIAAEAALLLLGISHDYYSKVQSILVYPAGYVAPVTGVNRQGIIDEGGSGRLGEAWYRGPVVLSWADAKSGAKQQRHGHNVVIHEFAHEIDMMSGQANGIPLLENGEAVQRWEAVMQPEYERLVRATQIGLPTFIDPYGATNRAEFFAVLCESFFEQPVALRSYHPDLYRLLAEFYKQDPAIRVHRTQ
jgi:Mlc titration factor MtfA (ptsG expression regulator)